LALGSIEKVVELSKDFMNEVFPFEEFTKISEGITKELAEYSNIFIRPANFFEFLQFSETRQRVFYWAVFW